LHLKVILYIVFPAHAYCSFWTNNPLSLIWTKHYLSIQNTSHLYTSWYLILFIVQC